MSKRPLFSTYSQGENRVTGSMIAVFERLDLSRLEQILGGALGETSLQLMSFEIVKPHGTGTVPDARIASNFNYLFEVKTEYDALRDAQLVGHLEKMVGTHSDERLFAITPDSAEPGVISEIGDERLRWFSFAALHESIEDTLKDERVSDAERFLLRELQTLFAEEGLLGREDTVIVAAAWAYDFYLRRSAYVCQAGRSFRRGLTHLGFYRRRKIEPHVASILHRRDDVLFAREEAAALRARGSAFDSEVADLIEITLDNGERLDGTTYQVFLLSGCNDPDTLVLDHPIRHDTDGRGSAWTMGQRYVRLSTLADQPVTTAELAGRPNRAEGA